MNKEHIKREKIEAGLAVFWGDIATNLPKTIERQALGDEKIFNAFRMSYPKIKDLITDQLLAEKRAEVEELVTSCDCTEKNIFGEQGLISKKDVLKILE